jgi:hypothetical protein
MVTPAVVEPDVATPAVIGEPPKFKFKPKVAEAAGTPPPAAAAAGSQLIGALPPPAPMVFPPSEVPPPAAPAVAEGAARRTLPPFPVIAGPGTSRTNPSIPVPHIKLAGESPASTGAIEIPASDGKGRRGLVWLLVLAALGAAGYFGWPYLKPYVDRFMPSKAAVKPLLTPADTLNKLAHAPAAAIDKAQDALAARRASGQTRVDAAALGEDVPEKTKPVAAPVAPKPKSPAIAQPPTMAPVGPGLAASVHLEAAPDASPEFRSFVATARVSGVFQGAPARVMINGKLTRAGETVDPGLGIIFEGLDPEKKHLIFRDPSGVIISRRY